MQLTFIIYLTRSSQVDGFVHVPICFFQTLSCFSRWMSQTANVLLRSKNKSMQQPPLNLYEVFCLCFLIFVNLMSNASECETMMKPAFWHIFLLFERSIINDVTCLSCFLLHHTPRETMLSFQFSICCLL